MRRGPNPELGLAILRVILGVVYASHGAHKLFVSGVGGVGEYLGSLGFPVPGFFAWFISLLEFGGGIALIVGFAVTPLALLLVVEMLLGIVLVHAPEGWFVIGPGHDGAEYNTLLIAALLALVLGGPGAASLDARRSAGVAEAGPEAPEIPEPSAGVEG